MSRPTSRTLDRDGVAAVRRALAAAGLTLRTNPKNAYVAFEARTTGNSIFTVYTSGKLVCTVQAGDGAGARLAAAIDGTVGGAAAGPARGRRHGLALLAGADETGTGELLGSAVLGGALFPLALADAVDRVAGHVATKNSRSETGWEDLGARLAALGPQGLALATLAIPNRLFDAYRKNALLDLAYVRLVGDLLAAAGLAADLPRDALELVIDDYGLGARLEQAMAAWTGRGMVVHAETKADDTHLAARVASVVARAQRAREMAGLRADSTEGRIGTGNAGDRETVAWLRHWAASRRPWPSWVKASFRTVTELRRLPAAEKQPVPDLAQLLDDDTGVAFLEGRLDVTVARLRGATGRPVRRLVVGPDGRPAGGDPPPALTFLPLLVGGLVLDPALMDVDRLAPLLDRQAGLLSGWRVLVGPPDESDPACVALMRAHRAGIVHLVPTAIADPIERARSRAAMLLSTKARAPVLLLQLEA